jgi:3-isopropylmalate dehydrogenase
VDPRLYPEGIEDAAKAVEAAVVKVLEQGCRTADIYQGSNSESLVTTNQMGDAIVAVM